MRATRRSAVTQVERRAARLTSSWGYLRRRRCRRSRWRPAQQQSVRFASLSPASSIQAVRNSQRAVETIAEKNRDDRRTRGNGTLISSRPLLCSRKTPSMKAYNVRSPRDRARSLGKTRPEGVTLSRVVGRADDEHARGSSASVLEGSRQAVVQLGRSNLCVSNPSLRVSSSPSASTSHPSEQEAASSAYRDGLGSSSCSLSLDGRDRSEEGRQNDGGGEREHVGDSRGFE